MKTGKTVEEINQQLLSRQILAAWTCPGIILNLVRALCTV